MPRVPILPPLIVVISTGGLAAQAPPTVAVDGRGVTFSSPDRATQISMRFRIQQLFTLRSNRDGDAALDQASFLIRRARFRLGGTVFDPRLSFNLQLSFTRNDLDFAETAFPNILRDASVTWRFSPNLIGIAGQTKLPGNRQRVISSSDLELPERSIVNNRFTFDRDVGVQLWWADTLRGMPVHLRGAISGGEGRNPSGNDNGLSYTARVEWLPFGAFQNNSDYYEGDLDRHPHPRLALAFSAQYNDGTIRTRGQLGSALHAPRTQTGYEADLLLKYRGLSWYAEWATRDASDPITTAPGQPDRVVEIGSGGAVQASYLIAGGWAPAFRWALVTPDNEISGHSSAVRQEQFGLGVTKYFNRHRVKGSLEVIYDETRATATGSTRKALLGRWGLEVGI